MPIRETRYGGLHIESPLVLLLPDFQPNPANPNLFVV